jgi:hypothetical protein
VISELLTLAKEPAAGPELRKLVSDHVEALLASAHLGDRGLVRQAEDVAQADPETAFAFDSSGVATLKVGTAAWSAGRFETPSIHELRGRIEPAEGEARLWLFAGTNPVTDIGALQATTDGRPLFQVASQFNCLEAPGPTIMPVASYFSDPTQGPRASISAFPATLLRHYAAPADDGDRFVQETDARQIDLLRDVFPPGQSPVRNGYLTGHGGLGAEAVAGALEDRFECIRVGIHDDASVVLGYDWDGAVENPGTRRIGQVFTSTVAGGGYGGETALGGSFERASRQLLRAAYLGTLLAAVSLRCSPVVLTLIGGGVFGNSLELIWDSIVWAFDQVAPHASGTLDVIANGRNVGDGQFDSALGEVRGRGGAVLLFGPEGLERVEGS